MIANPYSDRIVHGNSLEIAERAAENKKSLIEPGSHTLLVYNDLKAFREIYSQYSRALLPQNEIVVIGTQYDPSSSSNDKKNRREDVFKLRSNPKKDMKARNKSRLVGGHGTQSHSSVYE